MKTLNELCYDNCKNCVSGCEHAGKDREFVCPKGESCKIERLPDADAQAAACFIAAVKTIAQKPENLLNLEGYLARHFSGWLKKYAATPEDLAAELKAFAEMEI